MSIAAIAAFRAKRQASVDNRAKLADVGRALVRVALLPEGVRPSDEDYCTIGRLLQPNGVPDSRDNNPSCTTMNALADGSYTEYAVDSLMQTARFMAVANAAVSQARKLVEDTGDPASFRAEHARLKAEIDPQVAELERQIIELTKPLGVLSAKIDDCREVRERLAEVENRQKSVASEAGYIAAAVAEHQESEKQA